MCPQVHRIDKGGWSITIVGLGAVGSPVASLLVNMPGVRALTLLDDDVYTLGNVAGQAIAPGDVGMPKAHAQARRLRRLNTSVEIDARVARIEQVPLGILAQTNFAICCVDSRDSRRHNNRVWQHLNIPWIDVAVEPGGTLARVSAYVPGKGSCLQCAWGPEEYASLAQRYPCQQASPAPATRGNAATSAIAAALATMEAAKFIGDRRQELLVDRQVHLDALHHQLDVLHFDANPDCAADHTPWRIKPIAASAKDLILGDALALAGDGQRSAMRSDGQVFVQRLHCLSCAKRGRSMLRLSERLRASQRTCRDCGGELVAAAFDVMDEVTVDSVSAARLARPLQDLGFLDGDVFTLVGPREPPVHFHIGAKSDG